MLRVGEIKVSYGNVEVLKEVSLNVHAGEIVAIIGANGAGKTTLLKTLSGLIYPYKGSIEYLDKRIEKRLSAYRVRRGLVLVPEGRAIFGRMSVYENLQIGVYCRKDRGAFKEDMDRVFTLFPILRERKNMMARFLSGGEQQMLAIGRALMTRPNLLMMDEPSLGLAPMIVKDIFRVVEELRSNGRTILLVEQNAMLALKTADRGYVLELGRIVVSDRASALLESDKIRDAYLGISQGKNHDHGRNRFR